MPSATDRVKDLFLNYPNLLKCHYDENCIFSIEAILKHKQVACMRRKILFTIFKISLRAFACFYNMQISQVMTSYTQPDFNQI